MPIATFRRREIIATLTNVGTELLTFDIEEKYDNVTASRRALTIDKRVMSDYLETRQDAGLTPTQLLQKWNLKSEQLNDLEAAHSVCTDSMFFDVLALDLHARLGSQGVLVSMRSGPSHP